MPAIMNWIAGGQSCNAPVDADAQETQRVDRMSAFVEHEYVAGVFEVIDTFEP